MATLPAFLRRTETTAQEVAPARPVPARKEQDPYQLRPLPLEEVFFHCKRIDNSRLVREPDPKSRGACWQTIGAASLLVFTLGAAQIPRIGNTLAGYRLEELRAEERKLLDERRSLEIEEARLLSPDRLEKLAQKHHLVPPVADQVQRLDTRDGAVAMNQH
jgi:hypothetical protein